jgi:two-component system response regulator MprA
MSEQRRILVVDDQRDILDLASTILSGAGYAVSTASTGVGALDLLAEEEFDLVLLDINMPEMDGWQTLRLIRAEHSMDSLPVVMFSIKGEVRDKVHGMQEGALDYITKPFGVDELLQRVGRLFEANEVR